jgi:hypothetical protein
MLAAPVQRLTHSAKRREEKSSPMVADDGPSKTWLKIKNPKSLAASRAEDVTF